VIALDRVVVRLRSKWPRERSPGLCGWPCPSKHLAAVCGTRFRLRNPPLARLTVRALAGPVDGMPNQGDPRLILYCLGWW
jgi:hypothetical protein